MHNYNYFFDLQPVFEKNYFFRRFIAYPTLSAVKISNPLPSGAVVSVTSPCDSGNENPLLFSFVRNVSLSESVHLKKLSLCALAAKLSVIVNAIENKNFFIYFISSYVLIQILLLLFENF